MKEDANIFLKEYLMQIYFSLKEEKKVSSAKYLFQIYELYISINTDLVSF